MSFVMYCAVIVGYVPIYKLRCHLDKNGCKLEQNLLIKVVGFLMA